MVRTFLWHNGNMAKLVTAPIEEPFTLFLVGVQCRSLMSMWKIPLIGKRMTQMQKELLANPESGLLWGMNFTSLNPFTVLYLSYWKSSDHIHRFVTDPKMSHLPASAEYFKKWSKDPNLGVYHETYDINPHQTENLYLGMSPFGVSAFIPPISITQKSKTFLQRLRR